MDKTRDLITKFSYLLAIWLTPSNLFYKFFESRAYVNGRLVDYLIPKVYVLDLAVIAFVVVSFINHKKLIKKVDLDKNKLLKALVILLGVLVFRQLFSDQWSLSQHWVVSLIYLARIGLYLLFAFYVMRGWKRLKTITMPDLIITGLFQLTLAIYQFIYQKPLLAYKWLGESKIDLGIGIAQHNFAGVEQVLAYGTTAHPNILAGTVVFFWLWLLKLSQNWPRKNRDKKITLLGLGLLAVLSVIFMTQSITALLGLILALVVWKFQKKISGQQTALFLLSIILLVPILVHFCSLKWDNLSLARRSRLNSAGLRLLINNPLWGTGLMRSTTQIESVQTSPERVRFVQPPHQLIILWLAETGLLGLAIMLLMIKIFNHNQFFHKKNFYMLVFLAVLMSLDHYLLTSNSGLMILVLALFLPG